VWGLGRDGLVRVINACEGRWLDPMCPMRVCVGEWSAPCGGLSVGCRGFLGRGGSHLTARAAKLQGWHQLASSPGEGAAGTMISVHLTMLSVQGTMVSVQGTDDFSEPSHTAALRATGCSCSGGDGNAGTDGCQCASWSCPCGGRSVESVEHLPGMTQIQTDVRWAEAVCAVFGAIVRGSVADCVADCERKRR
jgi:hypothetical protein